MQTTVKHVPAMRYFVAKYRIALPEVPHLAGSDIAPLEAAARAAGFTIGGPVTFFYRAFHGDAGKPFDFSMGFPVAGAGTPQGRYELHEAPEYRCLSWDYAGGMPGIGAAWMQLYQALRAGGYEPGGESREIYKNCVDFESGENVTELQAGLA